MSSPYHTYIQTLPNGQRFMVEHHVDYYNVEPWNEHDGHGPVRCVRRYEAATDMRVGERVMHQTRDIVWLYDWDAACETARKDGWDTSPYGKLANHIERAVQADFDYCQGWLNDDWHWMGVVVYEINEYDGQCGPSDSLWGIESDATQYIGEITRYMIATLTAHTVPEPVPAEPETTKVPDYIPAKHHDVWLAQRRGEEIEVKNSCNAWHSIPFPSWHEDYEYRVKPDPKPEKILSTTQEVPAARMTSDQANTLAQKHFKAQYGHALGVAVNDWIINAILDAANCNQDKEQP